MSGCFSFINDCHVHVLPSAITIQDGNAHMADIGLVPVISPARRPGNKECPDLAYKWHTGVSYSESRQVKCTSGAEKLCGLMEKQNSLIKKEGIPVTPSLRLCKPIFSFRADAPATQSTTSAKTSLMHFAISPLQLKCHALCVLKLTKSKL